MIPTGRVPNLCHAEIGGSGILICKVRLVKIVLKYCFIYQNVQKGSNFSYIDAQKVNPIDKHNKNHIELNNSS